MATRAGKAFVDFEGNFDRLQSEAQGVVSRVGSSISSGIGSAFQSAFTMASQLVTVGVGTAITAGIKSTMAAARVDEMNLVLQALAKSRGVNVQLYYDQAKAVKAMGIETAVAQDVVAQFARSNLNAADASKLARVAQDAAVLSASNSTETLSSLIYGIQTQNTEVLRTSGIYVDGSAAMKKYAAQIGVNVNAMTVQQRQQAYLNAVLENGGTVAGAYALAMESPSKMLRTLPRYINDVAVNIGKSFQPAFGNLVFAIADGLKGFTKLTEEGGKLQPVFNAIGEAIGNATKPLAGLVKQAVTWASALTAADISRFLDTLRDMKVVLLPLVALLGARGLGSMPFIGQFAQMIPILNPWVAAFGALVAVSPELRAMLGDLFKAILPSLKELVPILADMAKQILPVIIPVLQDIFKALAPIIPVLVKALLPVIKALAPLLVIVVQIFAKLVVALLPLLPSLAKLAVALAPLIVMVLELSVKILTFLMPAIQFIIDVIAKVAQAVGQFMDNLGSIKYMIGDLAAVIGQWFTDLPGKILDWLKNAPANLVQTGLFIIEQIFQGLMTALPIIVKFVLDLPFKILGWLISILPDVLNIGVWILTKVVEGLVSVIVKVGEFFFSTLPKYILDQAWQMTESLGKFAAGVLGMFVLGLSQSIGVIIDWFKALPQRLLDNIWSLGAKLIEFGKEIMRKIVEGLKQAAPNLAGIIWDALKSTGQDVTIQRGKGNSGGGQYGATFWPKKGGYYVKVAEGGEREDLVPWSKRFDYALATLGRGQLATPKQVNYNLTVQTTTAEVDEETIMRYLRRMEFLAAY